MVTQEFVHSSLIQQDLIVKETEKDEFEILPEGSLFGANFSHSRLILLKRIKLRAKELGCTHPSITYKVEIADNDHCNIQYARGAYLKVTAIVDFK
jgi:hypothetical protein